MSGPEYEVTPSTEGYEIREPGQVGRGLMISHGWLRENGFGPLSRSNIDEVIKATLYVASGGVMQSMKRLPKDMGHLPRPRNFAIDGLRESGLVIAKR